VVLMAIVGAVNARQDMAETLLGMVGVHAGPAHEAPGSAAAVVQVVRHAVRERPETDTGASVTARLAAE
jgi:hypothetical protein